MQHPDAMTIPVRYLEVRHYWNYYDHPLDGVCLIDGRWFWFEWNHHDDVALVRPMTMLECIKDWFRWLAFYWMVGRHTTITNGKRGEYVGHKGWFGNMLERLYYRMHLERRKRK